MGIYGFLSAAYQETYQKLTVTQNQIEFLENKAKFYQDDVNRYDEELNRISNNISTLSNAKATSIQIRDTTVSGGVRSSVSTAELRLAQSRIGVEEENRKEVNQRRTVAADSLQKYKLDILELQNSADTVGELGPLQYLSGLTGTPMDKIINVLLLIIIFVFDPLAISLVIAANFAFDRARPKKNLYGEVEDNFYADDEWDDIEANLQDLPSVEDIEVKDAEEFKTNEEFIKALDRIEKDWKVVNEDDSEIKEKRVVRVLQKTPGKRRVQFDDGSEGWVEKGDEDKIVYL